MFDVLKIRSNFSRLVVMGAGVVLLLSIAGCNKKEPTPAAQTGPQTYGSPEDAGKALMEAAKADNQPAMLPVLGRSQRICSTAATMRRTRLPLPDL